MASSREKRDNAGENLADIISSLKPHKATKKQDIASENEDVEDDRNSESDGELADSFDMFDKPQDQENENEEIQALEKELERLKTERKKADLKRKIEEEKDHLKKLQLPPKVMEVCSSKGDTINDISEIIACSNESSGKALQIVNFLWPEPIPQYQTITFAGDMEFRVGKKKTLDKITIEEWGFANICILQELLKQKTVASVNPYLNYTSDIFRLASKYVWYSVLLYDKEYRDKQAEEKFEWGDISPRSQGFSTGVKTGKSDK